MHCACRDIWVVTGPYRAPAAGSLAAAVEMMGDETTNDVLRTNPEDNMDLQALEREYREKLEDWRQEIQALKDQAADTSDEARDSARQRIDELERQRDAAGRKLDELRDAGHHAIAEMKVGVEMAFKDLQQGIDAARKAAARRAGN